MIENKAKKFHLNENSGIKWKKSDAEIANYQLLSSSQWGVWLTVDSRPFFWNWHQSCLTFSE